MSGVSTGSTLLSVESRKFAFITAPSPVFDYSLTASDSVSVFTNYVIELAGETIISQSVVFTSSSNQPSFVFLNVPNSSLNRVTFSLSSTSTLGHNGKYKIVLTTASGKVLESPLTQISLAVHFIPMTTSYSVSSYNVSGSPVPISSTSPDSFGISVNSDGTFGNRLNINSSSFNISCIANNMRIYLDPKLFTNISTNVKVNIPDSSNFIGNYGNDFPISLTRSVAWSTASENALANFSSGSGQYLRVSFSGFGRVNWSTIGSSSTVNLVDGWWATEDGGDCKISPTATSTELLYKLKYSHVSGSTSWKVVGDSGAIGSKDVISPPFLARSLQLDASSLGTTTSTVRVGFYDNNNSLLYEQNIILTVNKTS